VQIEVLAGVGDLPHHAGPAPTALSGRAAKIAGLVNRNSAVRPDTVRATHTIGIDDRFAEVMQVQERSRSRDLPDDAAPPRVVPYRLPFPSTVTPALGDK